MSDEGEKRIEAPVATVLPISARQALIDAAKIKDPVARRAAIDAAEVMARARNPELFRRWEDKQ